MCAGIHCAVLSPGSEGRGVDVVVSNCRTLSELLELLYNRRLPRLQTEELDFTFVGLSLRN